MYLFQMIPLESIMFQDSILFACQARLLDRVYPVKRSLVNRDLAASQGIHDRVNSMLDFRLQKLSILLHDLAFNEQLKAHYLAYLKYLNYKRYLYTGSRHQIDQKLGSLNVA